MRVKLLVDPPCDSRHGLTHGRIVQVIERFPPTGRMRPGYWVMGDMGRRVLVLEDEAYRVED